MKNNSLVYDVGINDADYLLTHYTRENGKQKLIWRCHFYTTWTSMLKRCYSKTYKEKHPSYKDCSVCDEWLTFSNFKSWMESQDYKDKQLDKDLLVEGNKIYSPATCVFVDVKINTFTTDCNAARGKYPLGVYWNKSKNKFKAQCRNPFTGKQKTLGLFTNELEAHHAWKRKKHEHAYALANSQYCNDPRLSEALKSRYL